MRINDKITNRPCLVIDDEILDVTNLAVQGLDVMAAHTVSAAQMVIPCFLMPGGFFPLFTVPHRIGIRSPTVDAAPIYRVFIMPVIGLFKLAGDGLVSVQGGAVLDLLFG